MTNPIVIRDVSLYVELDINDLNVALHSSIPDEFFGFKGVRNVIWVRNLLSMFRGLTGKRFLFVLDPALTTTVYLEEQIKEYLSSL